MFYSNSAYSLYKVNVAPLQTSSFDLTSYAYDGLDDYQETNAWNTIDNASEFTISLWVKVNSLATTQAILRGYETGTAVNMYMNINTDGKIEVWSGGSGSNWTRSVVGAVTVGQWYHVVMRLADPTVNRYYRQKIFINGVWSSGGSNYNGGTIPSGTTLGVGANYNYSHPAYFYPTNGNINELAIWGSNALTDAQIVELYNNGKASNLNALPTAPAPTNWFRSESGIFKTQWSTPDGIGSPMLLTSRNMGLASRVSDVPT